MKNLFLVLPIVLALSACASTPKQAADRTIASEQAHDNAFVKIQKVESERNSNRYVFYVCEQVDQCHPLSRPYGYEYSSIAGAFGLHGRLQKYVGAPVMLIGETVGGVVVAFFAGSVAVPSATAAGVSTILWGGAAAGATLPSMSDYSSKLRVVSPRYYWNKGDTKIAMVNAVSALNKDKRANAAILYHRKNFESDNDFYDAVDIVNRILNAL